VSLAEIAERHLTKKAKKNIGKIIGQQKLAYWVTGGILSNQIPILNLKNWEFSFYKFKLKFTTGGFSIGFRKFS
jgi:hypothetical protein